MAGQSYLKKKKPNKQIDKLLEKEIRFVITRGSGGWKQELDEGDQKIQTSNYKINIRVVIYNMINRINTAVCYIGKLLRINPESSSQGKKILYLYEMMNVH